MSMIASQITGISIVYSTVCSDADQRKHQSSASLALVRGIHRWPVHSPHKGPVTQKMFPFDYINITKKNTHDLPTMTAPWWSFPTKWPRHDILWPRALYRVYNCGEVLYPYNIYTPLAPYLTHPPSSNNYPAIWWQFGCLPPPVISRLPFDRAQVRDGVV